MDPVAAEQRRTQLESELHEASRRQRESHDSRDDIGERRAEEEVQRCEHELESLPKWERPEPLPGLLEVPDWDEALLPAALRPWCSDIAERMQCPPEYPAVGAIAALGSVIGRSCGIRPQQHGDWLVIPNLWGAIIGPPGIKKSSALESALSPLRRLAHTEAEAHERRKYDREAAEAKLKALRKKRDDALKNDEDVGSFREKIEEAQRHLERADRRRRFLVNDATVEKLGAILQKNPLGVLVFRDELEGWFKKLSGQGYENARAFYLESWSGDKPYIYDRIQRGTIFIEACCVSLLGAIQPGPLAKHLRAAQGSGEGADGLMQRFQLLVYPNIPKRWKKVDRHTDFAAKQQASELFERLVKLDAASVGADVDDFGAVPFLHFDIEAQELFDEWNEHLENSKVRNHDEHPSLIAHFAKYGSLVPSLALIFQLADHEIGPVGLDATRRAIRLSGLLESHARRVYAAVTRPEVDAAKALLAKICAGKLPNPFTPRDVYQRGWAGLGDPEAVNGAVDLLEDYGYVQAVKTEKSRQRGRPKREVYAHPSLGYAGFVGANP